MAVLTGTWADAVALGKRYAALALWVVSLEAAQVLDAGPNGDHQRTVMGFASWPIVMAQISRFIPSLTAGNAQM